MGVTFARISFLAGVLFAGGARGDPAPDAAIRDLSSPSFEERQAASRRLAAEAARLEKAGDRKGLSALMKTLRACVDDSEDQEAREAARLILAPLLAGNPRWRKLLEDLPGRAVRGMAVPEGILLTNLSTGVMTDAFLETDVDGTTPLWIGLYDPSTGARIWETKLDAGQVGFSGLDVSEAGILAFGNDVGGGITFQVAGEAGVFRQESGTGWARLLDRKTGRTLWEAAPKMLGAGIVGAFVSGKRIVLHGLDAKGGGRVWCLDLAGDPSKPLWSIGFKSPPTVRLAPADWLGEPAVFVATPGQIGVWRLADGREAWSRKGEATCHVFETVPGGIVLAGYPGASPGGAFFGALDGSGEKEFLRLVSGKTGETVWEKKPPPGHVFAAAPLEGGVWAGGDAEGNLEGPWWMGLYDAATGKPRWEITGVHFPDGNVPIPHVSPQGILVGGKAPPFGGMVAPGFSLTFYAAATGKVVWKRVLEWVDTDVTGIETVSGGVLVFAPAGVSFVRLADADTE